MAACLQQESCQLSEIFERTEHHLSPYLPLTSQETLCPTGATSIHYLIPSLIAACPLFSIQQLIPVFVVLSYRSFCVFDLKAPDSVQLF